MTAELRAFGCERMDEVREIYREAGWRAYLTDDEKLDRAFQNSLYLLGAFDGTGWSGLSGAWATGSISC